MREVSAGGTPIIALITHTIQNLCLSLNQAKNQTKDKIMKIDNQIVCWYSIINKFWISFR